MIDDSFARTNNQVYQWFTASGCKIIGTRTLEYAVR